MKTMVGGLVGAALGGFCMGLVPTGFAEEESPAFISPTTEAARVGLAGENPADVARYLLARGAQSAAISSDGERIALIQSVTGNRQLWVMPADGGTPKQITFGNGVTFFAFAPDGKSILYGADNDGNEQESYYLIAEDGSSERLVLPAVAGGFRNFGAFSGDGTRFAFASTERNGRDFDIYVHDLATGDTGRVYESQLGNFVEGWVPASNTLVISQTVGEDSDNLYTLDLDSGERTAIYKPDTPHNHTSGFGGGDSFAFAADGTAYFSTNKDRDFTTLGRQDLADSQSRFEVIDAAGHDLETPVLCGGNILAYTMEADGFDELRLYDTKRGKRLKTPALPEGQYALSCARQTARLIIRVSAFDTPGDLYTIDLPKGTPKRVFASTRAGLGPENFVRPVSVTMPARDGVMLQGLLYLPDGVENPPVVFDVHGGPTGMARASFNPLAQYLTGRGIAVFRTNVRGSTGFGRSYLNLDNKRLRTDSVRDLVDMLAYFEKDGRVDASRAAVRGGSYGGYMVNAVLGAYPDAFDAGVCLFGVGDWVSALEVASPALKASDIVEYGDITEPEWRAFYKEISPVRNANKIGVPVLYSHGAQDPRIDKAETEVMVLALRNNGVRADYILIPDEGHGWRKLSNRLFYYRREAAFLADVFGLE